MNYDAYSILGVDKTASREEVDAKYQQLRSKYQKERFQVGEAGEEAAENLQRIEVAYRDILAEREEQDKANNVNTASADSDNSSYNRDTQSQNSTNADQYERIMQMLKQDRLDEAQSMLDNCDQRDAEWHYLQSILFYKRNWFLESKKQLEFALQLEPNNQRYRDSLDKLNKILASNTISPEQLRTNSRPAGNEYGYGNGTCTGNACCDCMLCNACCNCLTCMR